MIPPAFIDEPGLSGQPWWAVVLLVLVLFVAGLWIAARLAGRFIGRLPSDYFVMPIEQIPRAPLWEQALGVVIFVAGFIMLFTPGQGLLLMLVGLLLVDAPGKPQLLRRLAHSPKVRNVIDDVRRRQGAPQIRWPATVED